MSTTYNAFDHKGWASAGLKDFAAFSDMIEYVNQSEYGDGQLEGEWFFADDEHLPDGSFAIYWGTFGNDNSPGADSYTYAEVYSQDEIEEYDTAVREWVAKEEYLDSEEEEEEEEPTEPEEGDWITSDYAHWLAYNMGGKSHVTCPGDWSVQMMAKMASDEFWPNLWFLGERGNWELLDVQRGCYASE